MTLEDLKVRIREQRLVDALTMGEMGGPVNKHHEGCHLGKMMTYDLILQWLEEEK